MVALVVGRPAGLVAVANALATVEAIAWAPRRGAASLPITIIAARKAYVVVAADAEVGGPSGGRAPAPIATAKAPPKAAAAPGDGAPASASARAPAASLVPLGAGAGVPTAV